MAHEPAGREPGNSSLEITRLGPGVRRDERSGGLAEKGYDPVYGARPLKLVIQKDLVDPIARKLLAGELEDGGVFQVRAGEGALEIGKARVH